MKVSTGRFDATIDFDAARSGPDKPSRLAPAFDRGDHPDPSMAGHAGMAGVVDLNLPVTPAAR